MQNPEHQKSKCPTCGASRGFPCRKRNGEIAVKVHWGRPYWSSRVGMPREGAPTTAEILRARRKAGQI